MPKATQIIRSLYFYAVSIVALFMLVFSVSDLISLGLRTWVFPNSEPNYNLCIPGSASGIKPVVVSGNTDSYVGPTQAECDRQNQQSKENSVRERQNSAIRDFSMLIVALPLFLFHFRIVQKEWKDRKEA
jgi:hypothetical protein